MERTTPFGEVATLIAHEGFGVANEEGAGLFLDKGRTPFQMSWQEALGILGPQDTGELGDSESRRPREYLGRLEYMNESGAKAKLTVYNVGKNWQTLIYLARRLNETFDFAIELHPTEEERFEVLPVST